MSLVRSLVTWISHMSVGYGAPSVTDPPELRAQSSLQNLVVHA